MAGPSQSPSPLRRGNTPDEVDGALAATAAALAVPADGLQVLGVSSAVTVLVPGADGAEPRVVRAHRRSMAWSDATYNVLRFAAARGVEVPEPLGPRAVPTAGWTCEVYRYVPLDRTVRDDPHAHGALLAGLHLATADGPRPPLVAQRRATLPAPPYGLPAPLEAAAEDAYRWLRAARRAAARGGGCVVHGESGFANLWHTADGGRVLLDFDSSGVGDPMWDLAHAVGDRRLVSRDPGDWAALMEGYLRAGGTVDGAALTRLLPLRAALGALDAAARWHLGEEYRDAAVHRLATWSDPDPRWEPLSPVPVPPQLGPRPAPQESP